MVIVNQKCHHLPEERELEPEDADVITMGNIHNDHCPLYCRETM